MGGPPLLTQQVHWSAVGENLVFLRRFSENLVVAISPASFEHEHEAAVATLWRARARCEVQ
jgi:hypothetical protein